MPVYRVKVRELHEALYHVEAENPEDAFKAIEDGKGEMVDNSQEFVELTHQEMWCVTEEQGNPDFKPVLLAEILDKWLTQKFLKENEDDYEMIEFLDELVHDIASGTGSDANNGGSIGQIEFVVSLCGTGARKVIESALGED